MRGRAPGRPSGRGHRGCASVAGDCGLERAAAFRRTTCSSGRACPALRSGRRQAGRPRGASVARLAGVAQSPSTPVPQEELDDIVGEQFRGDQCPALTGEHPMGGVADALERSTEPGESGAADGSREAARAVDVSSCEGLAGRGHPSERPDGGSLHGQHLRRQNHEGEGDLDGGCRDGGADGGHGRAHGEQKKAGAAEQAPPTATRASRGAVRSSHSTSMGARGASRPAVAPPRLSSSDRAAGGRAGSLGLGCGGWGRFGHRGAAQSSGHGRR